MTPRKMRGNLRISASLFTLMKFPMRPYFKTLVWQHYGCGAQIWVISWYASSNDTAHALRASSADRSQGRDASALGILVTGRVGFGTTTSL